MKNTLLVIVDCLRYDKVSPKLMPNLRSWGLDRVWIPNHWSNSHCTDPVLTHMLSGRHPDELRLYSMMFEHKDYDIPQDVVMLPQRCQEEGIHTAFITGSGPRWYARGVDSFINSRGWGLGSDYQAAWMLAQTLKQPWFIILHTDDCHANYTDGTYDKACQFTDRQILELLRTVVEENTNIIITSDHGEGLGERGIKQHGFGLWPFLTHVPLITNMEEARDLTLSDNGTIHDLLVRSTVNPSLLIRSRSLVCQAGDTPPDYRHRGVVNSLGEQFIREARSNQVTNKWLSGEEGWEGYDPEHLLSLHCEQHGISYFSEAMEPEVEKRLRGLGYFDG